jgi:hypothetical protein
MGEHSFLATDRGTAPWTMRTLLLLPTRKSVRVPSTTVAVRLTPVNGAKHPTLPPDPLTSC